MPTTPRQRPRKQLRVASLVFSSGYWSDVGLHMFVQSNRFEAPRYLVLSMASHNEMAEGLCFRHGEPMKTVCFSLISLTLLAAAPRGFSMAQERPQKSPTDLLNQGAEALAARRFEQAIGFASQAIRADTNQPAGYALRAAAYIAAEKPREAVADLNRLLAMNPRQPRLLELRGTEKFKLRQFKEAIADFDQECRLEPAREPWHWKRGLAYYYAGQYDQGRDQFQKYHDREDSDVENAVWRVLCMARMPGAGLRKAQDDILLVRQDPRVPMMEVYTLFAGKAKPDDVLVAIERDQPDKRDRNSRTFYGNLYLGLYFDMIGETNRAAKHLKVAVDNPIEHFMWDIAKLHLGMVTTAQQQPRATKAE